MFRYFIVLLLAIPAVALFAETTGTAIIHGHITNPMSYFYQDKFHQKVLRFYFDNLLENEEMIVVPDEFGKFELTIALPQPLPLMCDYDGQLTLLFLSPNDDLTMSFTADNLAQTLKYTGKGAEHSAYSQQMYRQYASEAVENELRSRREQLASRAAYMPICENYRQREQTLLQNHLARTTTSSAFQTWAKAEATYRYAVRMTAWYFRSNDKQKDDYKVYSQTAFNFNDSEAVISNQYLQFLDYHLRNLSMRDPEEMRLARETKRIPWVVRAFELAQTELKGKAKEYALGKLLIDLIGAEYTHTPDFYQIFMRNSTDGFAQQAVEKRYTQFMGFINAEPHPDARLHVIDEDYNLPFDTLLAKYKGNVIYVDFWASWCGPCLSEMPYSNSLQKAFEGKNVVFLYLTPDDNEGKWRGNIARHQLKGEFYLMNKQLKNESFINLGVRALPHYALIDKQGNVVIADARKPSNALLRDDIDKMLK